MTGKIIAKCEKVTYSLYKNIYITENDNGYYYFVGFKNDETIVTRKFNNLTEAYGYLGKELEPEQYRPF